MTVRRFLAIGAFALLLIPLCGCTQTAEQQINAVLDEYAAAKYRQSEKASAGETKSLLEELKKERQEWAETMEPYVARILSIEGEVSKTLAEIARKDSKELLRIADKEWPKGKPDYERFRPSENLMRLSRRTDLSIYTLLKMGPRAADAFASLLKEPFLGHSAANSLGLLGQKEVLWKVFEDKNATEAERVSAAYALVLFFKEKKLIPFHIDSLLTDDKDIRQSWWRSLSSMALEQFPEETISLLLKAIEEGHASEVALTLNFGFLEEHGVDLQKGIRLQTPGREGKEVIFIYPTEPFPEEKIKSFLNNLKPEEKEKELLIEVGRSMPYKTFDRVMTLCEQAGIYKIKLGVHNISIRPEMPIFLKPLASVLQSLSQSPQCLWKRCLWKYRQYLMKRRKKKASVAFSSRISTKSTRCLKQKG
jgi:hypothetical protein